MTRSTLMFPTTLAAGALTLALGLTPHAASAQPFRLVARTAVLAPSTGEVTVRLKDFAFRGPAQLHAGKHVIRVINDGPQAREVVMVRLNDGKTAEDLYSWFRAGMQGEAPAQFVSGTVSLAPGGASTIAEEFSAGEYLLLSFRVSEAGQGEPEVAQGSILAMTVQ